MKLDHLLVTLEICRLALRDPQSYNITNIEGLERGTQQIADEVERRSKV